MIRLGDNHEYVQLDLRERGMLEGCNEGDLRLAVSVRSGTFLGSYDDVWIERSAWATFRVQMAAMEMDRKGIASVAAQSPDEFELHIEITSARGHATAYGFLSRIEFGHPHGNLMRHRIEYAVPLNAELLREYAKTFHAYS